LRRQNAQDEDDGEEDDEGEEEAVLRLFAVSVAVTAVCLLPPLVSDATTLVPIGMAVIALPPLDR